MDPPQRIGSDSAMSPALLMLFLAAADPGPIAGAEAGEQVPAETYIDILARAREGQSQCFQPDERRKTCKIMASYSFSDDGRIMNTAQMLMDETGPAILVVTSPVVLKNGAICGQLEHLPKARFLVAGQPATPNQESGYRLMLSLAPKKGEICARWTGVGNGYRVRGTLDGKPKKDFDQRMIWVEPGEGYVVAPDPSPDEGRDADG